MPGPALLRRCRLLLPVALLALAALPASAGAFTSTGTQFGQVAASAGDAFCNIGSVTSALYVGTDAPAPTGGTITSLETRTDALGDNGQFKVLRPTGGGLTYTIVADGPSFAEDAGEVKTFTTSLAVHKGDILAIFFTPGAQTGSMVGSCKAGSSPDGLARIFNSSAAPGTTVTLARSTLFFAHLNARATMTAETLPPILTVTQLPSAPPNGQDGYFNAADLAAHSGAIKLMVRATDDDSGVDDLACTGGTLADEVGSNPRTGHVDLSSDGTHTVSCTATDGAANTSSPTSTTVKIDATRPTVSVSTAPAAGSGLNGYFNASDPAVVGTVTASDDGSGLAGAPTCTIDNQLVTVDADGHFPISGDGAHDVICEATDKAGNTGQNADPVSVKIDRTKPTASLTPDHASPSNQSVTLDLSAADEGSSGLASRSCTDGGSPVTLASGHLVTVSTDGSHEVSCTVGDNAGNTTTATKTVVIDKTKPSISLTISPAAGSGPDGWYNAGDPAVTGAASASDTGGSGLDSLGCTIDGTAATLDSAGHFAISGDGTHTVTCSATDKAGNSDASTVTVKIDRTPPSVDVPANIVTAATSPQGAVVTWGAAAAATAASPCSPASGSLFPIGTTTVTCTATDQAGNTATKTFTVQVRSGAELLDDLVARYQGGLAGIMASNARAVFGLYRPMTCAVLQQALTLGPILTMLDGMTPVQGKAFIDAVKAIHAALGCGKPAVAQPNRTATASAASKARATRIVSRVKATVKKAKKRAAKRRHRRH